MTATKRRQKFDGAKAGDLVAIVPRDGGAIRISTIDRVDRGHIIVDRKLFTIATGTGKKNWYSSNPNDARHPTPDELDAWRLREEQIELHQMICRLDTDTLTVSQLRRIKAILQETNG